MTCPRTHLILRSLSGELSPAGAAELDRHVGECPVCRQNQAELRATWEALGAWQTDMSGVDLTDAVLAAAEAPHGERVLRMGWSGGLRVAASLACALGLGITAGSFLSRTTPQASVRTTVEAEDVDVADSLGLTGLGGASATGLGLLPPLGPVTAEQETSP